MTTISPSTTPWLFLGPASARGPEKYVPGSPKPSPYYSDGAVAPLSLSQRQSIVRNGSQLTQIQNLDFVNAYNATGQQNIIHSFDNGQ